MEIEATEVPRENQAKSPSKTTPLMQQYWDIKSAHADKILLFRMGDFFEMFFRDAELAAPILGIALTSRNKKAADETPMCGVPHHSIAGPINKLLAAGLKVAICEQVEDPKFAKGIVKRAVTRILSPGIVYDPDTLEATKSHYLAAIDDATVSFLDLSTGEAFFYQLGMTESVHRLLEVLNPVEIVASRAQAAAWKSDPAFEILDRAILSECDSVSDAPAGTASWPESAGRLMAYARHMQGESALAMIPAFEERERQDRLELSPTVVRHLEIFENYRGEGDGSLFHAVNRCKTSAGTRLLRRWLQFPLASKVAIETRLDRVEKWTAETGVLKELRRVLGSMGDLERRLGKIANPGCHPRDLLALADSLEAGWEATRIAKEEAGIEAELSMARDLVAQVRSTLIEEPPAQLKNGHFIRSGVDPQLDELIDLSTNSHQKIIELESRERNRTGISSLKVRFNQVFGYYIEITHTHRDKVPDDYQRKQTLANAERYVTTELEELEHRVLTAQGKRSELETEIFEELRKSVLQVNGVLLDLARHWSELDVVCSLAWLAVEQNYCRPRFSDSGSVALKGSRHPVVEQSLETPFVANDIDLEPRQALLLTGPNMAGKSTLMRQVAIAAILAQAGCFVPSKSAVLPIFDRIFTRIGASDFLAEGLSTFMVEMKETAEMLKSATSRSLVILDEVGRGTSTYDGMSLAQAILEYLLETTHSMTLFATHYHELTSLSRRYPQLINAHMSIHERGGEISFLHGLVRGPANKSYGIHVARLAGLPSAVTKRAGQILRDVEREAREEEVPQLSLLDSRVETVEPSAISDVGSPELACDPNELAVLEELKGLDIERITPVEALTRLDAWKSRLRIRGNEPGAKV